MAGYHKEDLNEGAVVPERRTSMGEGANYRLTLRTLAWWQRPRRLRVEGLNPGRLLARAVKALGRRGWRALAGGSFEGGGPAEVVLRAPPGLEGGAEEVARVLRGTFWWQGWGLTQVTAAAPGRGGGATSPPRGGAPAARGSLPP